jgi:hypothetical protein
VAHITSGALKLKSINYLKNICIPIYPGVPLVSLELLGDHILAIPKSPNLTYPVLSNKIFSGFISRWIIASECKYSRARTKQAAINSFN